ncbi:GNAT family N-acetyltransferase [Pontibacter sp. JH31]|uniref:GNAT family N-acetyltransferase n=1 Tax=Pontibacter aquaedesilientis TaxID=2766980 RepID=A0ABR7XI33_9BACT|nr:GNAT family N-acetyltransferase [Pontibacter aquaedesilientis]MBD1397899.1 GNAT family N-acetyltransferase [Pontibacter aquaedesilientis]
MIIKKPESKEEFEQIFKLNYETFVEEIPQHEARQDRKLIDQFHSKNNYLIAVKDEIVIGMVSYNTQRPFSLDKKKVEIDSLIPEGAKVVEIRLLVIDKKWRKTRVTFQILKKLFELVTAQDITLGFISAASGRLDFYKKIGFVPFGEMVGKQGAFYQPMYINESSLHNIFPK